MWVQFLVREDPLAKGMTTHSSILAWRIPWTEETGSLHSIGLQRAGHNWITSTTRAFLFSKLLYFVISTEIMLACLVTQSFLILAAPWTVAHQAPLSMVFSRQEYWSGLPFPPPEDLPDQGLNPGLQCLLHWQVGSLPQCHLGRLTEIICWVK